MTAGDIFPPPLGVVPFIETVICLRHFFHPLVICLRQSFHPLVSVLVGSSRLYQGAIYWKPLIFCTTLGSQTV